MMQLVPCFNIWCIFLLSHYLCEPREEKLKQMMPKNFNKISNKETMYQREDRITLPLHEAIRHSFFKKSMYDQTHPPPGEDNFLCRTEVVSPAQPQLTTKVGFTDKKCRVFRVSTLLMASVVIGVLLITFSRFTLQAVDEEVSRLLSSREQSGKQVKGFETNIRLLHQKVSAFDIMTQKRDLNLVQNDLPSNKQKNAINALDEVNTLQRKVKSLADSVETLKAQIQEVSRIDAEQKYGSGVHHVEIQLVFPNKTEGPDTFVIELAPIDLMPYSVHFFLEMVSSGLLDGFSFILNVFHVLKAAPLPYDGSSSATKERAFSKLGLESIAFREYSESYPHVQHTVGFAADGSPSFYLNTDDNSKIHEGDPCFGKIVSGFDAVQRLEQSPTKNGIWFEERIGIKRATILPVYQIQ